MTRLRSLALAVVTLAALVVTARAETVQPFFLCEREEAFELARAYEASQQAVMDTMGRLPVPGRCVRHPPGQVFEVAEIVAGPLRSHDGLPFFVVRVDIKDGPPLYGLTWRQLRGKLPI